MKFLVTGAAGFIGMHVAIRLLEQKHTVIGVDSLNSYYDVSLKESRLEKLREFGSFQFVKMNLADSEGTNGFFHTTEGFDGIIHLAAQPGVRYSLVNPHAYIESNINGFLNILENARKIKVPHLVYASSSSVYGSRSDLPFSVGDNVDNPVSLYAATKKSNELMAYTYSHLYGLPVTGLRFFTVYGPWGRPDMAPFLFTKAILEGATIDVFNEGQMLRDFTYVDDIVEGVLKVSQVPPTAQPPYQLFNIGNNKPVRVSEFIGTMERILGVTAKKRMLPMQPGDVPATWADIDPLKKLVGFEPKTSIDVGMEKFIQWYRSYYKI